MANENEAADPSGAGEAAGRAWRPSGRPDYRADQSSRGASGRIVERTRSRGWLRSLVDLVKLPAVKVAIGVCLFILAAIVFDATLNNASWTERTPKKAVQKQ